MNDLFALQEYRGAVARDNALKSKFSGAQVVVIDTQFDGTTAQAVANAYLAATKSPAQSYTFVVEESLSLAAMTAIVTRVALTYGTIAGYVGKITAFKVDRTTGQTTITIRGVA